MQFGRKSFLILVPSIAALTVVLVYQWTYIEWLQKHSVEELSYSPATARSLEEKLKKGGDPNVISTDGDPIVFTAIRLNNSEGLRILLNHGALVDLKNGLGQSPYEYAILGDKYDSLRVLCEHGRVPPSSELKRLLRIAEDAAIQRYLSGLQKKGAARP